MANKKGIVAVLNVNRLKNKFDRAGKFDITPPTQYSTLIVQQSARHKVRKKTRTLERGIDQRITRTANGGIQGEVFTAIEYAPPLEFGVNHSYVIKPKDKKALFWAGAKHPVKQVVIPPRQPYPFMRPALNDNKLVIRKVFTDYYRVNLAKLRA